MAKAMGYECAIIMPDDVAEEKAELLLKLGAKVEKGPSARPRRALLVAKFGVGEQSDQSP